MSKAPPRFTPRTDDSWPQVIGAALLRAPWAAKLLVAAVIGSGVGIAFTRFVVLERVNAQDAAHILRIEAAERADSILESRVRDNQTRLDGLDFGVRSLLRLTCLKNTLADQEIADMSCPPNLYLGAPR